MEPLNESGSNPHPHKENTTMKYDDASWHYEGDFPENLPREAGATHTGLFVAWMLSNGFASEELIDDFSDDLEALQDGKLTGPVFVMTVLDEKFTSDELTDEGNAFTLAYYQGKDNDSTYVDDYLQALNLTQEQIYTASDDSQSYEALSPIIAKRLEQWRAMGRPEFMPSPSTPV